MRRIALATAVCAPVPAIALVSSADAMPTVRITNQVAGSFAAGHDLDVSMIADRPVAGVPVVVSAPVRDAA